MIHSLREKNLETMTGNCSVDGWTAIGYNGHAYFCKKAKRESIQRSKARNPKATQRGKQSRSKHQLSGDVCAVCGPVVPAAWGRGYMCPNRMREMGWTPQERPTSKCPVCMTHWLKADGTCPSCQDREATDVAYGLMLDEGRKAAFQFIDGEFRRVIDHEDDLPEAFDSVTPDVPVLGAATPWNATHQVRPEYAAIWLAGRQKEHAAHG